MVAVGADGQTPDLAVVTLRGGGEKPEVSASDRDCVPFVFRGNNRFSCYTFPSQMKKWSLPNMWTVKLDVNVFSR